MAGVKLWSPKGNLENGDTHIGLASGHTMVIPHAKTGVEVPSRFRKEAIARGCIPVGMADEEEEGEGFDRNKVIKTAIKKMLESDEPSMFTRDGKPNLGKLVELCGFSIDRNEANRVFDELNREADPEGADDDDKPTLTQVSSPAGTK